MGRSPQYKKAPTDMTLNSECLLSYFKHFINTLDLAIENIPISAEPFFSTIVLS